MELAGEREEGSTRCPGLSAGCSIVSAGKDPARLSNANVSHTAGIKTFNS